MTLSLIPTQLTSTTPPTIFFPTLITTISPPPTLEPKQAEEIISEKIKESIDCAAPCFWGITPGITNLDTANEVMNHLGLYLKKTNAQDNRTYYYTTYSFSNDPSIDLILTIQEKIVTGISAFITPEVFRPGFSREWLAYSPETLIKRYGNPTNVQFFIARGAPAVSYDMVMYFNANNLIIEYYGYDVAFEGKMIRICPVIDQLISVRIWLGKEPTNPPLERVPLEKATSMTLEEFSKAITDTPDKACIFIKAELFP